MRIGAGYIQDTHLSVSMAQAYDGCQVAQCRSSCREASIAQQHLQQQHTGILRGEASLT